MLSDTYFDSKSVYMPYCELYGIFPFCLTQKIPNKSICYVKRYKDFKEQVHVRICEVSTVLESSMILICCRN
jgi:hypothetical protein